MFPTQSVPEEKETWLRQSPSPGSRVINGRQVPEVGTWAIDSPRSPKESSLEIEIDASTIDTRDADRDAHLRSSDLFRVEDHPTISFRSSAVRRGEGESNWKVDGDLTIRWITRPVTVDVEFLAARSTPGATSGSASRA